MIAFNILSILKNSINNARSYLRENDISIQDKVMSSNMKGDSCEDFIWANMLLGLKICGFE